MAEDCAMALDDRVAKLENTMAKGFFDQGQRMDRLEDRISALDSKLDVVSESIRGEVTTLAEVMHGFMGEMRRTTDSMRQEHEADRRLTRLALFDHVTRIRKLEDGTPIAEN